jgi:siroheme synthase
VIVSRATHAQQQVRWSTVSNLSREETLPAPALLIVGRVASHQIAEISESFWNSVETESSPRQIESIV